MPEGRQLQMCEMFHACSYLVPFRCFQQDVALSTLL